MNEIQILIVFFVLFGCLLAGLLTESALYMLGVPLLGPGTGIKPVTFREQAGVLTKNHLKLRPYTILVIHSIHSIHYGRY